MRAFHFRSDSLAILILRRTAQQEQPLGAPAYVAGMTLNDWIELPASNTAADVEGSFSPFSNALDGIWEGWNGFTYSDRKLRCWGGGHGANSCPIFFDFDVYDLVWTRDARGVPATTSFTDGIFTTGAPRPPHTYYGAHVRTLTGEIVQPICETDPGAPDLGKRVCMRRYSPASGTWGGGQTDMGTSGGDGVAAAYDPALDRSVLFVSPGSGRYYYDHATETLSTFSYPVLDDDMPCTFLPAAGVRPASYLMMIANWSGSGTPFPFVFINTASPGSASRISAVPSGVHSQHNQGDLCMLYSRGDDAVYVTGRDPDGLMELRKYQAPSTVTGTWTGVDIPVTGVPIQDFIQANSQGGDLTRGKAQHVEFPDGSEVLYLSGWPTHPVYAQKIREAD